MFWTHTTQRPALNAWRELQQLTVELERAAGSVRPALNVYGNDDGWTVRALVPGFALDDIELHVEGRTLSIALVQHKRVDAQSDGADSTEANSTAAQSDAAKGDATQANVAARKSARLTRTLELPHEIEIAAVEARCANGVLEIVLPRAVSQRPRQIQVRAG